MSEPSDWSLPKRLQPQAGEIAFDLDAALAAIVTLKAEIPDDAFTAPILGSERVGNGVVIRDDGLTLTVGYLITEAETIWITAHDGSVVAGHALAYDFASGLGLVLPIGRLPTRAIARATAEPIDVGDTVIVAARGGRQHALKARVFAKRVFAGYWEYVLDEALFTTPAHPEWSGAALLDLSGRVIGIGSLFVEEDVDGTSVQGNMFVPVDLLEPILESLLATGRAPGPPRGWLGMYTAEREGQLVVDGVAETGPAARAGVRPGDVVAKVAGERVGSLIELFRCIWRQGPAGTTVPLTVSRGGRTLHLDVRSADRNDYLRKPRLQ